MVRSELSESLEVTCFGDSLRWVHFKRFTRHRTIFLFETIDPKNVDKPPSLREGLPETAGLLIWYSIVGN